MSTPDPATSVLTDREKLLASLLISVEQFLILRGEGKGKAALSAATVFGNKLDEYIERKMKT
jgi:hypothetical protein